MNELDGRQEARNHPAVFYLLSALVILLGCSVMLMTLVFLPEEFFSPSQLALGAGIAFAVSFSAMIMRPANCSA